MAVVNNNSSNLNASSGPDGEIENTSNTNMSNSNEKGPRSAIPKNIGKFDRSASVNPLSFQASLNHSLMKFTHLATFFSSE